MWTDTKILTYKSNYRDSEISGELSVKYRNVLDFDLEFNTAVHGQYDLAIQKINQVKFELAELLLDTFSFYEFQHDYVNSKKSKLPTKTRIDGHSFISKIYTIPEANISLRAEQVKYSLESYKKYCPNIVYCSKNANLLSEHNLDSYIRSKIEVIFNSTDFRFYKELGFDLMLISFIGWTKVRVVELEKIDIDILTRCKDIMLFHKNAIP